MSLTQPALHAVAFAALSIYRNEIPVATEERGFASFEQGFPYETMIKKVAGGIAPGGEDFNGIFHYLSQHQVWLNAGGTYKFNAELAEALNGYAKGAVLASNDGLRLYVSTVDENKTDFNTDQTGWKLIGTSELQTLLNTLQSNIDAETAFRISADEFVNAKIDSVSARVTVLENAPQKPAIGVGQQTRDVTANRSPDTNYINSSGSPIEVSVTIKAWHGNAAGVLIVDGVTKAMIQSDVGPGGWIMGTLTAIVPNLSSFRASGDIYLWTELSK